MMIDPHHSWFVIMLSFPPQPLLEPIKKRTPWTSPPRITNHKTPFFRFSIENPLFFFRFLLSGLVHFLQVDWSISWNYSRFLGFCFFFSGRRRWRRGRGCRRGKKGRITREGRGGGEPLRQIYSPAWGCTGTSNSPSIATITKFWKPSAMRPAGPWSPMAPLTVKYESLLFRSR